MALPESGMSMVLAIDADVFRRRIEEPFKTAPAVGCPADMAVVNDVRMRLAEARFRVDGERVLLGFAVEIRATAFGVPVEVGGEVRVELGAGPTPLDGRSVELVLTYDQFVLDLDLGDITTALAEQVQAIVEPLLAGAVPPIPLDGILPAGASLVAPGLVRTVLHGGSVGSTLLIGLEVDGDTGVDRARFRDDFADDLLAGSTADWSLQVDGEIVRQRADDVLAAMDFTENAPDGNGIAGWLATTSTAVLWSGDPITIETHGEQAYILANYDEHPLWFVVEGLGAVAWGFAVAVHAVGYADIVVDAASGEVVVAPHIFRAGAGFIPLPIGDQPTPTAMLGTAVGDDLVIEEIGFDMHRLSVMGVDQHPGMPGAPKVRVDSQVRVDYMPPGHPMPGHLCKAPSATAQGELLPDGTVVARSEVANIGEAPLWVCGLGFGAAPTVFSVGIDQPTGGDELEFPVRVDAGEQLNILVMMQVPDGDHQQHVAQLEVRTNDFDTPRATVHVRGRVHPAGVFVDNSHACFTIPEDLHEKWKDWQWNGDSSINWRITWDVARNVTRLVDGVLPRDAVLGVSIVGLASSGGVVVHDGRDRPVALTSVMGAVHHLVLPLTSSAGSPEELTELRFEHVGRLERGLGEVRLDIGQLDKVLDHSGPGRPRSAVVADGALFAAFDDGIHVVPLARGRASAVVPHRASAEIDAVSGWLFVRGDDGVELIDVGDPRAPRHVKTIAISSGGGFRAVPGHLVVTERAGVSVYGVGPGALPVRIADLDTAGALPLVVPWGPGLALVGESGALILGRLDASRFDRAELLDRDGLPPMLRTLWDTRVDDRTSLVERWQQPVVVRLERGSVQVLRSRPSDVGFRGAEVAAFLRERMSTVPA